jgi:hypothetical protein
LPASPTFHSDCRQSDELLVPRHDYQGVEVLEHPVLRIVLGQAAQELRRDRPHVAVPLA